MLQGHAVLHAVVRLTGQNLGNAIVAERIAPIEADDPLLIGIVARQVHLIGGGEPAFLGIVDIRHFLDLEDAGPVIAAIARRGEKPVMLRAFRHEPRGVPAGIAVNISIMDVGGRDVQFESLTQRRPVPGQIDCDDGELHVGARQHRHGCEGDGAAARGILRDDWAALRIAQRDPFGRRILDGNLFLDRLERLPFALVPIMIGIIVACLENEEIGLVDVEIGAAEGKAIGMALHDAGQAGRSAADDIEPRRRQMSDVAWTETANAQMRIIGENWSASCRA